MATNNIVPRKSFSAWVIDKMGDLQMSQADLVKSSLLSKTTVSRIIRNSNDKGLSYQPTLKVVMAISLGLGLDRSEANDLLFSAFPEVEVWGELLDERLNITRANIILYELGLPLLGITEE